MLGYFVKGYTPIQVLTSPLAPSPNELCQIGQPISDAIMHYRENHGRFPETLDQLEINLPNTFFGPFTYAVTDHGNDCGLVIGDYDRYLFEVYWSPADGWYVDIL